MSAGKVTYSAPPNRALQPTVGSSSLLAIQESTLPELGLLD